MALSKRHVAAIFGISVLVGALAGAGLVSAAQPADAPAIRSVEGNLTLVLHGAEVRGARVQVQHASLEIQSLAARSTVRCACESAGILTVEEFRMASGTRDATGFSTRVQCHPSTGYLDFVVEPDAAGDYRYDFDAPALRHFSISRCELIER